MIRRLVLTLALLLAAIPAAWAWDPQAVFGAWWTPDHDGVVDITPCGTSLCGIVTGVTAFRRDGTAKLDTHGQSRCHLQIIRGGSVNNNGVWTSHITDPDDDLTYTIQLRVDEHGRLRMLGYIGVPWIGETVFWTRFDGRVTPDCHILS